MGVPNEITVRGTHATPCPTCRIRANTRESEYVEVVMTPSDDEVRAATAYFASVGLVGEFWGTPGA